MTPYMPDKVMILHGAVRVRTESRADKAMINYTAGKKTMYSSVVRARIF